MGVRIEVVATGIRDLVLLQRNPLGDERGYLERLFCVDELGTILADRRIVQINHTLTAKRGTVRGMHFQLQPHAETKIVSCLRGEVFDVAIDLRRESQTFLDWHGEVLSGKNHRSLFIPEGFAHGFQTLTDDCEMLYLHTAAYEAQSEAGVSPRDPRLDIAWPLPIEAMSLRDSKHPALREDYSGVVL